MLSNAFYRDQTNIWRSLQFDPAPRAGEPLVSRRVPDYFLVSGCLAYALSSTCSSRIIVMKRFNLINVHIFKTVQWLFRWAIKTYTFSPSSISLSLVSLITASEIKTKTQLSMRVARVRTSRYSRASAPRVCSCLTHALGCSIFLEDPWRDYRDIHMSFCYQLTNSKNIRENEQRTFDFTGK